MTVYATAAVVIPATCASVLIVSAVAVRLGLLLGGCTVSPVRPFLSVGLPVPTTRGLHRPKEGGGFFKSHILRFARRQAGVVQKQYAPVIFNQIHPHMHIGKACNTVMWECCSEHYLLEKLRVVDFQIHTSTRALYNNDNYVKLFV